MFTAILSAPFFIAMVVLVLFFLGFASVVKAFYVKVPQGTALIVNDMSSTPKVHFTGALVFPIIYKKEYMKISLITLELDRKGKEGLICLDNMRADITVAFYLRVNETQQDVLRVAKAIGVDRACDKEAVSLLFSAKFSEALKTVGKKTEFVKLFEDRIIFREKIIETIGDDLNGYVLEDVAIDYLEQTPKQSLDPDNILDAQGIKKITELTAKQNVETNDLERNKELAITKKNVETQEALLALQRQEADAREKQKREVANIQARERAEILKVAEEERLKSETARILTEQEVLIKEENKKREIEVAAQNRFRAIAIEEEKVLRAREIEVVAREKDVALNTIAKEKALEVERKDIANVVRERIAVDKTVATEEERIKEVRVISDASRQKQAQILAAEALAEEGLIQQIKAAEAQEVRAKHKAAEINILADAELTASAKTADAKIKLAQGITAEESALGLASAKVKEAHAVALEKEGLAEARVLEQKMLAEARGIEGKGEADASKQRNAGLTEADVIRERFKAEAEGLLEKFSAMNSMSEEARGHEEFRLRLEKRFDEALATLEAHKAIAKDQASALGLGLQNAKIDIVSGESDVYNTLAKGISMGKGLEGLMDKSPQLSALLGKFTDSLKSNDTVESAPFTPAKHKQTGS